MPSARPPLPYDETWQSPVGWLGLRETGGLISELRLHLERPAVLRRRSPAIEHALAALAAYFAGADPVGIPPLAIEGTQFQCSVWQRLRAIGFGETLTYGALAQQLRTHPRAIGGACRANPILIFVPCHRVVAAQGNGGFAGRAHGTWPSIKTRLLTHETRFAA